MKAAIKMEAIRLAKNVVKAEMKHRKIPISHVSAVDIRIAAEKYLENNLGLYDQAKFNLEAAHANPMVLKAETQG